MSCTSDRSLYYLPNVVHESRTPGGRKIRSMLPLFPGYMFLYDANRIISDLRKNVAEGGMGLGTGRRNFLRPFRGVSKKYLNQ